MLRLRFLLPSVSCRRVLLISRSYVNALPNDFERYSKRPASIDDAFAPKDYEANRKRKAAKNDGRGAYAGKVVKLPAFISSVDLAKKLRTTMMKFSKTGRGLFDWWPKDTDKDLKKHNYESIKPLVFTFEEASAFVKVQYQVPQLENLDATDLEPDESEMQPKVPVVTILGHVDHGKTTLLDRLRGAKVAQSEPGWITQDTYSFQVKLSDSLVATFLDTPGHQNFFNMRANGAFFSDLVLLVVAADEGMQAQTLESLRIAKEHSVPICVAITKIDTQNANIRKVRRQLKKEGLDLVDPQETLDADDIRNGRCYVVPISALRGDNISLLTATLTSMFSKLALQADQKAIPEGAVVEAFKEPGGRGDVARLILRSGTLHLQEHFACGITYGRVRGMKDENGVALQTVTPGIAFELWGCEILPSVGDDFFVGSKEHVAQVAKARLMEFEFPFQDRILAQNNGISPDEDFSEWEEGDQPPTVHTKYRLLRPTEPVLEDSGSEDDGSQYFAKGNSVPLRETNRTYEVVVKTNNVGSLRMLMDSFYRFNKLHGSVLIKAVSSSTGRVTIDDIIQASVTPSQTVFCLRTGGFGEHTRQAAETKKVKILTFSVFHELLDAVFEPFFENSPGLAEKIPEEVLQVGAH